MSKGVIAGLGAVVLAAGGITAGLLSGDIESITDGGLDGQVQEIEATPIFEHQVLQRGFVAGNGRAVRVVGVSTGRRIEDVEPGRLVIVDELPDDAICPAVFSAPLKKVDGEVWPNTPTMDQYFEKSGFRPVPMPRSKQGNNYVWHGYVLGQEACESISKYGNFYGSSMKEFLALPMPMQRRFLVTDGTCKNEEGKDYTCKVPVGDKDAIPGAPISFPHSLAGRVDINFVVAVDGGPVDRYQTPDGGFATGE